MSANFQDSVDMASMHIECYAGTDAQRLTSLLVDVLHYCDNTPGVSWQRCLAAASAQHQKEVREDAISKPIPQ